MRVLFLVLRLVALLVIGLGTYAMLQGGWFGSPVMAAGALLFAVPVLVKRLPRRRTS